MKIHPVAAESFHAYGHDEANSPFRSLAKESKKGWKGRLQDQIFSVL
jgi:hypothetical protein